MFASRLNTLEHLLIDDLDPKFESMATASCRCAVPVPVCEYAEDQG